MQKQIPDINNIKSAYKIIQPVVHFTPVVQSTLLNTIMGCKLLFKCENMQGAGAFKYRGASHAVLLLNKAQKSKGVCTHSSGNHAGALAKAAQLNGLKAYIVMPNNAPKVKVDAVKTYGGIITFCEPTLKAREETLEQVQQKTGALLVHPYDDFNVICGQGTACLEMVEQIPEPDIVMTPVGGGGLLSGTAICAKALWKGSKVIAAEPLNANDAYIGFKQKKLQEPLKPNTIADGLLTALSKRTFQIMIENVDAVLTAKEETIVEAMKLIYQYLKIVVEPSSAVPLAALMENSVDFKNKTIAIIITGGNVDLKDLPF